jgi:DNA-directed RNA polymerase subunit omega
LEELELATQPPGSTESKFRFIIIAARRARQLQGGSRPLLNPQSKKFTSIAQEEVASGLVPYEIPELPKLPKKRGTKGSNAHARNKNSEA